MQVGKDTAVGFARHVAKLNDNDLLVPFSLV
jgi:hypothetical protein